jgi:hypothetical protein
MKPEIIGTLAGKNVLLDRASQSLIIDTEQPIKFPIDHPYIQGTKLEREAREALAQPPKFDLGPCMYADAIVAADNTCLRCGAADGQDCRDI